MNGYEANQEDELERSRLRAALLELPVRERTILVLEIVEEFTLKSTAKRLRLSVATVAKNRDRALRWLRRRLSGEPAGDPTDAERRRLADSRAKARAGRRRP